jgi:hypothetical protein
VSFFARDARLRPELLARSTLGSRFGGRLFACRAGLLRRRYS